MGNEIKKTEDGGFISILHKSGGIDNFMPFEREIFLFDTHIAGTTHVDGIEELFPHLDIEEKLNFFREPENEYDPDAIVIKTENGVKLGYVPKIDNIVFARLMDAGKHLFGKISHKELVNTWCKIEIKVYLKD